jgi:hypothetical protein
LPEYPTVNASIVQKLDLGFGQGTELRLDVLNIGDAVYQIRNGRTLNDRLARSRGPARAEPRRKFFGAVQALGVPA